MAVISRVPDNAQGDLLRYLAQLGLVPGSKLMVIEAAPFDGPLTIEIDGQEEIIGNRIASSIRVEVAD